MYKEFLFRMVQTSCANLTLLLIDYQVREQKVWQVDLISLLFPLAHCLQSSVQASCILALAKFWVSSFVALAQFFYGFFFFFFFSETFQVQTGNSWHCKENNSVHSLSGTFWVGTVSAWDKRLARLVALASYYPISTQFWQGIGYINFIDGLDS